MKYILPILLLIIFLISPQRVQASVLFEDNFDDGNDNGWTRIGTSAQNTWNVVNGVYKGTVNTQSTNMDTVVGG